MWRWGSRFSSILVCTSICCSSNTSVIKIKKKQQDVVAFLEALKVDYTPLDIACNEDNRAWMRQNVPEEKKPANGIPLPPQIFNEESYCGDYDTFFNAKEDNSVYAFLGLPPPPGSKEAEQANNSHIMENGTHTEETNADENLDESTEVPVKERNGEAHGEGDQAADDEEGAEGDADDEAEEEVPAADEEEEAVEETDEAHAYEEEELEEEDLQSEEEEELQQLEEQGEQGSEEEDEADVQENEEDDLEETQEEEAE